jgi:prepilin-type N-terminal cleavage/methylation domain-containing protein
VHLIMGRLRLLLRGARSQGGFSLPELLIAMMIGLGTAVAVMSLLDVSVKQSNAVAGRVNATQRARLAMDQITRQLRSQVCYSTDINALIEAKDDSVTFHADLSDGSRLLEKRELTYDPATKKITEKTWAGVANPDVTLPVLFPALTRTRMLVEDVVRAPVAERLPNAPVFRYYRYDTAVPPRPSIQLTTPVSTADLKLVAKIDVGFRTLPPASKTTPSSSVTLYNEIYVRVANPNDPVPKPICA